MINEHLKQNDEVKHDLTISENIENLQLKIKENNDLLKENLKKSYERLRKIQATYFQSHVAEQLNKILELKEKLKLDNYIKKEEEKATQFDDNSVDLLTSILKSNLNNNKEYIKCILNFNSNYKPNLNLKKKGKFKKRTLGTKRIV